MYQCKQLHLFRVLSVATTAFLLAATSSAESGSNKPVPSWEVRLDAIDSSGGSISVTNCGDDHICSGRSYSLTIADAGTKTELKNFHVGDHLIGPRTDDKGQLISIDGLAYWWFSSTTRLITLALCASILLGFAALATKGAPQSFVIGADNRYSNSKFQIAVWFWLLLSTYLSAITLRVLGPGWSFFGSVNIPQNLLLLSGLSALTYAGAKAITTAKVDTGVAAGVANPKPPAATPNFFADLVKNDGTQVRTPVEAVAAAVAPGGAAVVAAPAVAQVLDTSQRSFDFGDFQMLVVTLVAVIMYLMAAFHFLGQIQFAASVSLPDVDTTVLSAFGLGQGAYLVKKAAGNVGTT